MLRLLSLSLLISSLLLYSLDLNLSFSLSFVAACDRRFLLRPTYRVPLFLYLSRLFPRVECRSSFEHENGKARCGSAAASETNKGINHHHHHHHRHRHRHHHHHHTTLAAWPSRRRAISRFFFRGTSILEMCRGVARSADLFVRDTREESPEPAVKKRISSRCCAPRNRAAYMHDDPRKLLSKVQRNPLSRYI